MLKLSKLIDYATIILISLDQSRSVVSSSTLATNTGIPEPTVAKILKLLTKSSLTKSLRGPGSGYFLLNRLDEITLAKVITIIEGPIRIVDCDNETCRIENDKCTLYGKWSVLNDKIKTVFETLTLADLKKNSAKNTIKKIKKEINI